MLYDSQRRISLITYSNAFTLRPSAFSIPQVPSHIVPQHLVLLSTTAQVPSLMVPQHELTYDGFPHAFTQGPSALESISSNYSSAFTRGPSALSITKHIPLGLHTKSLGHGYI